MTNKGSYDTFNSYCSCWRVDHISSFDDDDDDDKDDKCNYDDDEHNCSEFLKLICKLACSFFFLLLFKNKREAEETIYKKYLTTKKTQYVELMIIVDNVVVSEQKIKQLNKQACLSVNKKKIHPIISHPCPPDI